MGAPDGGFLSWASRGWSHGRLDELVSPQPWGSTKTNVFDDTVLMDGKTFGFLAEVIASWIRTRGLKAGDAIFTMTPAYFKAALEQATAVLGVPEVCPYMARHGGPPSTCLVSIGRGATSSRGAVGSRKRQ